MATTSQTGSLDKTSIISAIDQLRSLPPNWDGYKAPPIDPQVIQAARELILSLPDDIITTPKAVPMTRGRLQLEWHRGSRSLEIEFENSSQLHFLKWDPGMHVEEEDVISASETSAVHALLRWFESEASLAFANRRE
jgi:hypothetical protein